MDETSKVKGKDFWLIFVLGLLFSSVATSYGFLKADTDRRFDKVDAKFERIDATLTQLKIDGAKLDAKFDQLNSKFDQSKVDGAKLDAKFDMMQATLNQILTNSSGKKAK